MDSPIADLKDQCNFMAVADALQWEKHGGGPLTEWSGAFSDWSDFVPNYGSVDYPPFFTVRWKGYNVLFVLGIQSLEHGLRVWADFNQGSVTNGVEFPSPFAPQYATIAAEKIVRQFPQSFLSGADWIIGGHSWGGIISSVIAANILLDPGYTGRIWHITAESPRALNPLVFKALEKGSVDGQRYSLTRYFNDGDVIPTLPPFDLILSLSEPKEFRYEVQSKTVSVIIDLSFPLGFGQNLILNFSPPGLMRPEVRFQPLRKRSLTLRFAKGIYEVDKVVRLCLSSGMLQSGITKLFFEGFADLKIPDNWAGKIGTLAYNKVACSSWFDWSPGYLLYESPKPWEFCWQAGSRGTVDLGDALQFLTPDSSRETVHQMRSVIRRITGNMQRLVLDNASNFAPKVVEDLTKAIEATPPASLTDRLFGPVVPRQTFDRVVPVPVTVAPMPVTGTIFNRGSNMIVPRGERAKVKANSTRTIFTVEWMDKDIATHPYESQAKTMAKKLNQFNGFALNMQTLDATNWPLALSTFLGMH